jgi:hypothetical protein
MIVSVALIQTPTTSTVEDGCAAAIAQTLYPTSRFFQTPARKN